MINNSSFNKEAVNYDRLFCVKKGDKMTQTLFGTLFAS